MKAVIIDDEKKSCTLLSNLITEYCNDVQVSGIAHSVVEGTKIIHKYNPDVVFLDIEMPQQNGFQLFEQFDAINFEVIFITAYDEYAIKAFRFSAIDYLLKPIYINDLEEALHRVRSKREAEETKIKYKVLKENMSNPYQNLALPTAEGMEFIQIEQIVYCEADSNYTHVFLSNNERHIISRTLGKFEELLQEMNFQRIHNSYLINLNHVVRFVKHKHPMIYMSNGAQLKISQTYKNDFFDKVSKI